MILMFQQKEKTIVPFQWLMMKIRNQHSSIERYYVYYNLPEDIDTFYESGPFSLFDVCIKPTQVKVIRYMERNFDLAINNSLSHVEQTPDFQALMASYKRAKAHVEIIDLPLLYKHLSNDQKCNALSIKCI